MKQRKIHIVAVYAPPLQTSERDPGQRDELYNQLDAVINNIPKRDIVFVAGDFNAKVGSLQNNNPNECIGQHGTVQAKPCLSCA